MPQQAHLRVYGHSDIEVDQVEGYLRDLDQAYNSLLVFDAVIDKLTRSLHGLPLQAPLFGWPLLASSRSLRSPRRWPPTPAEIKSLVPVSEKLILTAVELRSPGFWEFLGSLNVLEVIRKWVSDWHERRKDREYRETAERRRLEIENFQRETEAIADRLKLAKELGLTDYDLAPLVNDLVLKPLLALNEHQYHGVIERAEILRIPDRRR